VGFGKRLFGRKWRGTDYRVSAIPLGGYVRVIGLGPDESTITEGTSREAAPVGKRWQRALILLAGPGMNLVLAVVLHTLVFTIGVKVPAYELSPAVIGVVAENSPAAQAGLKPGDRIVSIDGTETPRWRDAEYMIAVNARARLEMEVDRSGTGIFARLTPRGVGKYDYGDIGVFPDVGRNVRGRIGIVVSGSPAAAAGLKKGDVIVSVAGRDIRGGPTEMQEKFIATVQANAPGPLRIAYERDGRTFETAVQPRKEGDVWRVGVQIGPDVPEVLERFPVGQALVEGWRQVRTEVRLTMSILGRLFRGAASMKSMSGPLDIAKFSGEAARTGAVPLVALMAAISLQLGIFNLLPIPVLDGGHLFLLGVEGVARRDFSLRVKERILQVGFVMILALLAVVLYNDLSKNLPTNWWPFR
jgi:regulator of sigma E protease